MMCNDMYDIATPKRVQQFEAETWNIQGKVMESSLPSKTHSYCALGDIQIINSTG